MTAEQSAAEPMPAHVQQLRPRLPRGAFAGASDERLVALSRAGEQAAFEEIVQRHRPALLARCRRMLDPDAAEDAVQLAFVSAWRALQEGCEVAHPRAWLHAVAHRSALQSIRARPDETDEIPELVTATEGPAEQLEQRLRTRATLAALADLPAVERDALLLAVVQGHSGRDTARALGVSEGAVRQAVFRARAHLRSALAAPLAWPLLAGLASRWRVRTGAAARPPFAAAPVLGRAAAVVVAGAIVGAPLALHAGGGGHAPRHIRVQARVDAPTAVRPVPAGVAPSASPSGLTRRLHPAGAVPSRAPRGAGAPAAAERTAPAAAGSRATDPAVAADAGRPPGGTGASAPVVTRTGSATGAPVAGRAGSGGPVGETVGTATSGAGGVTGGVVQEAGRAAGGAVSGVTHTAEAVVGQVAGSVSAAAPVLGTTVQGAGATVTQTLGATGETVTGLVEHVTATPAQPVHGEEQKPVLGGLLGR